MFSLFLEIQWLMGVVNQDMEGLLQESDQLQDDCLY